MSITSKYDFMMKSTPPAIEFGSEDSSKNAVPLKEYNRIFFNDSIFSFYPTAEIFFRDSGGLISDKLFFVEGLELATKLGYPEETDEKGVTTGGYLEHEYVWSENQMNNIIMSSNISGDNIFILVSKYAIKDIPKSKSYNYNGSSKKTIDQIIKNDLIKDWNLSSSGENKKQFITATNGFPFVNQVNMTNRVFIELLSEFAYSNSYPTSCFYTFINSRGEFYFMAMEELLAQPPTMTYEIDITQDMMTNEKYIKSYMVMHGGMPVNLKNYKKQFYNYSSAGVASTDAPLRIHDAIKYKTSANEKLLIRKQYVDDPAGAFTHDYVGILDEENSVEYFKGYKNSQYKNSNMSYRMIIVVQFNPKIVSGKTISIKIQKATKDNEIAQEYAGIWLVCESAHLFDKDGVPYSQLTVSKPKIAIDSDHPFKGDFV